jgi:hypothetical protein
MSLMMEGWMPSVGSSSMSSAARISQGATDGELLLLPAGEVAAAPAQHVVQHRKQVEDPSTDIAALGADAAARSRSSEQFSAPSAAGRFRAPAAHRRCRARARVVGRQAR